MSTYYTKAGRFVAQCDECGHVGDGRRIERYRGARWVQTFWDCVFHWRDDLYVCHWCAQRTRGYGTYIGRDGQGPTLAERRS